MNILGIDDNEDILMLLDTVISSKGHDFTQVMNGKDGVKGDVGMICWKLQKINFISL